MPKPKRTFLIVDDHSMVRAGLAACFEAFSPRPRVLQASTGTEALACLEAEPGLDLIFLDFRLDEEDGLDLLVQILERQPLARVIVLSGFGSPGLVLEAKRRGARGFIAKAQDAATLLEAAETVLAGRLAFDPAAEAAPSQSLTPRQLHIMGLLSRGLSNKEIAAQLDISVHTARAHLFNIYKALGAGNRIEALRKFESRGR